VLAVHREKQPAGVFVGLTTLDVVHRVTSNPGSNEKVTAQAQFVAAGGPAANAAVAFAALGGNATLVTALGSDPAADLVRADLRACAVTVIDAAAQRQIVVPVSAVAVNISTAERSVVSIDATAVDISPPRELRDAIDSADVVLIDGHHPQLALAAANAANAANIDVVIDGGRWKPVMQELIPLATTMICSDDFFAPGLDDSESTACALVRAGVRTVVTTHGGDPVLWWQAGESGLVDVPPVRVVDTLGAGDIFHGAYCYFSHRREPDIGVDVMDACAVAAFRCSIMGPRAWLSQVADSQHWSGTRD
jgi:sugar/nucleoside kinase (ribokinase family)